MLKPGTIVGGTYRLSHLIADGGMSEVYLSELCYPDSPEPQQFAVKRLLPELAKNPIFAQLFEAEACLATVLHHHNIVACHEYIKDKNNLFMVMEYIVGKEIGIISKAARNLDLSLRIKIAVAVGLGVIDALCYVHGKTDSQGNRLGIVHGDISPQNIMVTMDGVVKLYDFGAAHTGFLDKDLVRGNLRYMSPEQAAGQGIDARSDIFSLSLVLLELIQSDAISHQKKLKDAYEQVLKHLTPSHYDIAKFFNRALAYEREQRFLSSQEMQSELLVIAESLGLHDPEASLKEFINHASPTADKYTVRNRRFANDKRPMFYFFLFTLGVGFFVWVILSMFGELFEPKYRHNIPYWPPTQLNPHEAKTDLDLVEDIGDLANLRKNHGMLSIKVNPWATVSINGRYLGMTPIETVSLSPGRYIVELRNPHISAVALRVVTIYADKKTDLYHSFK
jgi:serine/threonine protein kinase